MARTFRWSSCVYRRKMLARKEPSTTLAKLRKGVWYKLLLKVDIKHVRQMVLFRPGDGGERAQAWGYDRRGYRFCHLFSSNYTETQCCDAQQDLHFGHRELSSILRGQYMYSFVVVEQSWQSSTTSGLDKIIYVCFFVQIRCALT